MLEQDIRKWYKKNGHFAAGLQLLAMTGTNTRLYAQLQGYLRGTWVPDTAKAQLRTALKAWLSSRPKPESSPVEKVAAPSTVHRPPSTVSEPPAITALRAEAKQWHKRHSELKGRLNLMIEDADNYSDETRAETATEIMTEVIPALDGIYAQIKEWKGSGKLPKPPNERDIVAETVEKTLRLTKNLPPRISKLKKYLREKKREGKELTPDEITAYRKELVEKEGEVVRLRGELGV